MIVMQGLPSSWKTTLSSQLCQINPDYFIRVCNDDIRIMLWWWVRNKKNDHLVKDIISNIIKEVLRERKCIIIDNTNLYDKTVQELSDLALSFGIKAQFCVVHPWLDRVLENNTKRQVPRSEAQIKKMYEKHISILENTSNHVKYIQDFDRQGSWPHQYSWW